MRAQPVLFIAVLLAPGCVALRSHEGKVQMLESADPEERYDNLLGLASDADGEPERQIELADLCLKLLRNKGAGLKSDPKQEESVAVRLVAIRLLGRLAKKGVRVPEITRELASSARKASELDFWCRLEALDALGALVEGPANSQPEEGIRTQVHDAFIAALSTDPDRDVKVHAARELALLKLDTKPVLEELVKALSDETADVRYHAQRALVAIAGDDHGPTGKEWKAWADRHSSEQAQPK